VPPLDQIMIDNLQAGSASLSEWLKLSGGKSPAQAISPILNPVQDLREFQREVFGDKQSQAVAATQQSAFSLTVPNDERWKLVLMWIQHVNLGTGGVVFEFIRTFTHILPALPFTLWRGEIDDSVVGEVVYPSAVQRARIATNSFVDLRGNALTEFDRGDVVGVRQVDAAVTPGTVQVAILCELIPRLLDVETRQQWFSTAV